jgi:hypothetical protein
MRNSLMRTRDKTSESVTHPQISPVQSRLTLGFFGYELPEKKLQLVVNPIKP